MRTSLPDHPRPPLRSGFGPNLRQPQVLAWGPGRTNVEGWGLRGFPFPPRARGSSRAQSLYATPPSSPPPLLPPPPPPPPTSFADSRGGVASGPVVVAPPPPGPTCVCVCTQNARYFMEESNIHEEHDTTCPPRLPPPPPPQTTLLRVVSRAPSVVGRPLTWALSPVLPPPGPSGVLVSRHAPGGPGCSLGVSPGPCPTQ